MTAPVIERAFDPGKHPRIPSGHGGGRFTSRPGGGGRSRDGGFPWSQSGDVVRYHDSMGLDRSVMPQLSGVGADGVYHSSAEMLPKFTAWLRAQGYHVQQRRVDPESLRPTQTTGDMRAIRGIAEGLKSGELPDTKPITVSSDNRVLDGHHNWAGRLVAGREGGRAGLPSQMQVLQAGAPMADLIELARKFSEAEGIAPRATGVHGNPQYARPPLASRRFDPNERRNPLTGEWTAAGAPGGFGFEGPPGGTGHARAMEALARALDEEPGGGEAAQTLRNAIKAMVARDLPAAHRHLDGAIYQDQIATEGRHRPELEAVKASLLRVPRAASPQERLPAAPPSLTGRKGRRAGLSPGVIGQDASGAPAQFSGYAARAAAGGRHIPGTDFNWEHGWSPLTLTAAKSHYHNRVPPYWTPAGHGRTGAKASGKMSHGDFHEGYQAVAQAPSNVLGSERSRYVRVPGQEHPAHVTGSWSDPWWMTDGKGGWAVSRRWKHPAQKGTDWTAPQGARSFDIPAADERVLTQVDATGVPLQGEGPGGAADRTFATAPLATANAEARAAATQQPHFVTQSGNTWTVTGKRPMTYQDHFAVDPQGNWTQPGEGRRRYGAYTREMVASGPPGSPPPAPEPEPPAAPKPTRAEREAAAAKAFPLGTQVTTDVYTINSDTPHPVTGTVVGHKNGRIWIDTENEGTLAAEPGKVRKAA